MDLSTPIRVRELQRGPEAPTKAVVFEDKHLTGAGGARHAARASLHTAQPGRRDEHSNTAVEMRDSRNRRQRWRDFEEDELVVLPATEYARLVEIEQRYRRSRRRRKKSSRSPGRPVGDTRDKVREAVERWTGVCNSRGRPLTKTEIDIKIAGELSRSVSTVRRWRLRDEKQCEKTRRNNLGGPVS